MKLTWPSTQVERTRVGIEVTAAGRGARPSGQYGGNSATQRYGDGQTIQGSYVSHRWNHCVISRQQSHCVISVVTLKT